MSCGWCGYICVKRAGCRTDSDCGFSRVIGCTGAPPPPLAGDKPQRYIFLATLGSRCLGDGGWRRRPVPELIPDRSPGHAFIAIADAGWRRHTKV